MQNENAPRETSAGEQSVERATGFVDRLLARIKARVGMDASIKMVFGEEHQIGDRTIIPVAWVAYGFGGGGGIGTQASSDDDGEQRPPAGGGGGGGGGFAAPVAVIEVSPSGTRVLPIINVNELLPRLVAVFAGIAIARARRHRPG